MKLKESKKIWRLTTAARNSMKIPSTHFEFPPSFFNSTTFNSIFDSLSCVFRLLIVSTTLWSVFLFSRQLCPRRKTFPSSFFYQFTTKVFNIVFLLPTHNLLSHIDFLLVIHSGRLPHSLFTFLRFIVSTEGYFHRKGNYWLKLFLRDETWNCRQKRGSNLSFRKAEKSIKYSSIWAEKKVWWSGNGLLSMRFSGMVDEFVYSDKRFVKSLIRLKTFSEFMMRFIKIWSLSA